MLHKIKTVRTSLPTSFPLSLSSKSNIGRRETSVLRFSSTHSDSDSARKNMDKTKKLSESEEATHGDVMSYSFGEGYATRSEDEGFGGIYRGNQSLPETGTDKFIHENHPDEAYDKTQGSEVKEKEKGRHQTNAKA